MFSLGKKLQAVLICAVWFKVGWLLCVLYGNAAAIAVLPLTLWIYTRVVPFDQGMWRFVAVVAGLGFIVDSILLASGFITFVESSLFPPLWLLTLWILFATLLLVAIPFLLQRNTVFAMLCCVAGTLSYFAGETLSHASFALSTTTTITILAAVWLFLGVTLPLIYSHIVLTSQGNRYA